MPSFCRRSLMTLAGCVLSAAVLVAAPPARAEGGSEKAEKTADFVVLGDFTINLPSQSARRRGYMVVSITIETAPGTGGTIKDITPRVKEAVLQRLMAMSERGQLRPDQTDPLVIKDTMFETIAKFNPSGIKDVLITRILYT